jgi:hypothetical protein
MISGSSSPGQKFDPETDKIFMIGLGGTNDMDSPMVLNGFAQPPALRLKAGVKYRLRFINITPQNQGLIVSLQGKTGPAKWRALAKDGADLPPALPSNRTPASLFPSEKLTTSNS